MFWKPPSITVTPVLASGITDKPYTIPDSSGRSQILCEPPIQLRYAETDTPFSAPDYDETVQVLGSSMEPFGLPNGHILLCKTFKGDYQPKVGDKVIRTVSNQNVHQDWMCLRQVHSVQADGKILLKSSNDGKDVIDNPFNASEVLAKVLYKIPKPSQLSVSVIAG